MKKIILAVFLLTSIAVHTQTVLYGTTYKGGTGYKSGTIYRYDPATTAQQVDYSFPLNDFVYPEQLTVVGNVLYGVTRFGGAYGKGTIFMFDPVTKIYTHKYDFTSDFYYPAAALTPYNGKLFGITSSGGANGYGALFFYEPESNTVVKKIDFTPAVGYTPTGKLLLYNNKLYGATKYAAYKSVYEYTPADNTISASFFGSQAGIPQDGLCLYNNIMYGVYGLGSSQGIYTYNPFTKEIISYPASGSAAYDMNGPLLPYNGKMYVTGHGGVYGNIIEFDPSTKTFTLKYSFTGGTDGKFPTAPFCEFGGKLYSVTRDGGSTGDGTLFEFNPVTNSKTVKVNFIGKNGAEPYTGLVIYPDPSSPTVSIQTNASITEGNSGSTNLNINVSLNAASTVTVNVEYRTKDQTATAGNDYKETSGMLTFLPGEVSKTVKVKIYGDVVAESNEKFNVLLSKPVNAVIDNKTCVVTILTDESLASTAKNSKEPEINAEQITVKVTPNPVKGKLLISGLQPGNKHYIQLVNTSGNTILNRTVSSTGEIIDVSKFTSGVYWLRYFNGSTWQTIKVTKE